MREHEVPTHVQAEDKVLLWLTFPQIVAVVAVCAVSYGAYRYFPLGPSEFRLAIAVLLGIAGIAAVVGKVGGRGLPLVAADLLRFKLGARRYAGPVSELARPEAPAPVEARPDPLRLLINRALSGPDRGAKAARRKIPVRPGPGKPQAPAASEHKLSTQQLLVKQAAAGFIQGIRAARRGPAALTERQTIGIPAEPESRPQPHRLMIRKAMAGLGRAARAARRKTRPPFRAHGWFGKRRRPLETDGGKPPKTRDRRNRKARKFSMALAALALAVATLPAAAMADGPWSDDAWRLEEIGFLPPDPVPGRRLYLEELTVIDSLALVTLRAATDLKLDVRSYGGDSGRVLTFFVYHHMQQGDSETFGVSLDGPDPSFTFAWQDDLGQTGALALKGKQLPHPPPSAEGEVCDLSVDTIGWTPGAVNGVILSQCSSELEERVSLPVSAGHHSQSVDAVLPARVSGVTGTVSVSAAGASVAVPFVPGGETHFSLPVAAGDAVHEIVMEAALTASLSVPVPPLVRLTHHPHRVESRTETVSLLRPGVSRYVSRTVSVALPPNGRVVQYTVGATLSVPSETVQKDVTLRIDHPDHVRAQVVSRSALARTRSETTAMTTTLVGDAVYRALSLPDPTPTPEPVIHSPVTGDEAGELFGEGDRREFP